MFKRTNAKFVIKSISVFILILLFSSSFFFDTAAPPPAYAADTDNIFSDNVGIGTTGALGLLQVGSEPNVSLLVTAGGKVGIGTTSPAQKLQVAGNVDVSSLGNYYSFANRSDTGLFGDGNYSLSLQSAEGITINIDSNNNGTNTPFQIREGGAGLTGGTPLLTVLESGNVGIGTTNPGNYKLYVNGDTYIGGVTVTNGALSFGGDLNMKGFDIINTSNIGIGVSSPGTAALAVMSGNVGIGTTSPANKLEVYTASDTAIRISTANYITQFGQYEGTWQGLSNPTIIQAIGTAHDVAITGTVNSPTSGIVIKSGGNVGIGTTSPSAKLDVNGNIIARVASGPNAGDQIVRTGTSGNAGGYLEIITDGVVRTHIGSYGGDNTYFNAGYGGFVGIGTNAPLDLFQVGTSPNVSLLVTGAGKVGIGNTTPSAGLTIGIGTNDHAAQANSAYITGNLEVDGSSWLGDAASDNLTVVGTLTATGASMTLKNINVTQDSYLASTSGNVGIGTTDSGSYKLLVNGNTRVVNMGDIGYYDGLPTITSEAYGSLRFKARGGNYHDLVVATSGNVGIGTTSPSYNFHVYGTSAAAGNISALVQNANADGLAFWRSRTSDGVGLNVGAAGPSYTSATMLTDSGFVSAQSGLNALVIGTEGSMPIIFYTGGINASNEKVRITSAGNVGIGTTDPGTYKLYVNGDTYIGGVTVTNGALSFGGDLNMKGYDIINTANIGIGVSNPGTAALAVLGGNVGIGTTAPQVALDVNTGVNNGVGLRIRGDGSEYYDIREYNTNEMGISSASYINFLSYHNGPDMQIRQSDIQINQPTYLSGTNSLYVGGNTGIGIATAADRLEVNGNVRITSGDLLFNASGSARTIIDWYGGDVNGVGIAIGGGARTILGGGESAGLAASNLGATTERLDLTSDNDIMFTTNLQTDWASRVDAMYIASNGRVGIGTVSPAARLHALESGVKTADNYSGYFKNTSTNTTTDGIIKYGTYVSSTGNFVGGTGPGTKNFGLYVDTTSGADTNYSAYFADNVGIGTTNPGAYKLNVNGDVYIGGVTVTNGTLAFGGDLDMKGNDIDNVSNIGIGVSSPGTAALAVLGGNVGIGTTTPDRALHVVTTADVAGIFEDSDNVVLLLKDTGGATNAKMAGIRYNSPKFDIVSAPDNYAGQTPYITVDTSTSNVGIGTASPVSLLDVNGRALFGGATMSSADANDAIYVQGPTAQYSQIHLYTSSGPNGYLSLNNGSSGLGPGAMNLWTQNNYPVNIGTNSTIQMTVTGGGNVGIGTTTPTQILHINSAAPQIFMQDSSNAGPILGFAYSGGSVRGAVSYHRFKGDALEFFTGGGSGITNERMIIQSDGNVGIGTTSPGQKLEVNGRSKFGITGNAYTFISDGGTTDTGNFIIWGKVDGTKQVSIGQAQPSTGGSVTDDMVFSTYGGSWAEKMRLTNSGNLGIGLTSASNKLAVYDSADADITGVISIGSGKNAVGAYVGYGMGATSSVSNTHSIGVIRTGSYGKGDIIFLARTNPADWTPLAVTDEKMRITSAGNVGIGTTNPGNYKLNVNGDVYIGGVTVTNGALGFGGDLDMKGNDIDNVSNIGIGVSSPGTAALAVLGGNIGIGTTNPQSLLHVYSSGTSNQKLIQLGNMGTADTFGDIFEVYTNTGNTTKVRARNDLSIYASQTDLNATPRLYIKTDGNVGIGTTAPSRKLDVFGDSIYGSVEPRTNMSTWKGHSTSAYLDASLISRDNSNDSWIWLDKASAEWGIYHRQIDSDLVVSGEQTLPANSIGFVGGNSLNAYINLGSGMAFFKGQTLLATGSGNVGIGTTAPDAKLKILSASFPQLRVNDETGAGEAGLRLRSYDGGSNVLHADIFVDATTGSETGRLGIRVPYTNERITILGTGNVGIGTTNPTNTLYVNGSTYFGNYATWGNQGTLTWDGAKANTFNILGASGKSVSIGTNGVYDRVYVDTAGNVGIGTTNPGAYKLNVNGDVYIGGVTVTNGALGFGGDLDMKGNDIDNVSNIGIGVSSPGTAALAVLGGNVGIGSTNPTGRLTLATNSLSSDKQFLIDASGAVQSAASIELKTGTNAADNWNIYAYGDASGHNPDLIFRHDYGTEYMRITSGGNVGVGYADPGIAKLAINGNVGIGTTSPANRVSIAISAANAGVDLIENNSSNVFSRFGIINPGTNNNGFIGTISNNAFLFYTNGSEKMRITESGNVGIGTTNPGNYKLNVNGDVYIGGVTVTNGALGFGGDLDMKGNDIDNVSNIGIGVSAPGTAALAVLGGNVGIGTTDPTATLTVVGWIKSRGHVGSTQLELSDESTYTSIFRKSPTANGMNIYSDGVLSLGAGGANEKLYIKTDGKVGIGTVTPAYNLDVGLGSTTWSSWSSFSTDLAARHLTGPAAQKLNSRASGYAGIAARNPGTRFSVYMVAWDGSTTLENNCQTQINSGWHAQAAVKGNYFNQSFNNNDFTQYSSVLFSQADFDAYKSYGTQWWIACSANLSSFSQSVVTGSGSTNYIPKFTGSQTFGNSSIFDSGNVGIGTSSPVTGAKLDIQGGELNLARSGKITFNHPGQTGRPVLFIDDNGTYLRSWDNNTTDGVFLQGYDGTNVIKVENTGNVGIGTVSPLSNLHVRTSAIDNSAFKEMFTVQQNSNTETGTGVWNDTKPSWGIKWRRDWSSGNEGNDAGGIYMQGSGGWGSMLGFRTASSNSVGTRMVITENGSVGIGTTVPASKLQVVGSSNEIASIVGSSSPYITVGTASNTGGFLRWNTSSNTIQVGHHSVSGGGGLYVGAGVGNVGIGTTNPGAKLHVEGDKLIIRSTNYPWGQLQIGNPNTNQEASIAFLAGVTAFGASPAADNKWVIGAGAGTGATGDKFGILHGANVRVAIDSSGNVGIGTTAPTEKLFVTGTAAYPGTTPLHDANDRPMLWIQGMFPNVIMGSNGNTNHGSTLGIWNYDGSANTHQWNLGGGQSGNFSIGYSKNSTNPHCGVNGYSSGCTSAITAFQILPNGNIGIGTTGPANTFEIVGGGGTFSYNAANGLLTIPNEMYAPSSNWASAPGDPPYTFSGDDNTGMFSPGGDILGFSTAGVNALMINASGNVGIGTTNPGNFKLNVAGDVYIGGVTVTNGTLAFGGDLDMKGNDIDNVSNIGIGVSSPGTAALAVLGGNVGIGMTNPAAKLEVGGNVNISSSGILTFSTSNAYDALNMNNNSIVGANAITIADTGSSEGYMFPSNGGISVYTTGQGGYNAFVFDTVAGYPFVFNTGNVGIGTTGPQTLLHVSGTGDEIASFGKTNWSTNGRVSVRIGEQSGSSMTNQNMWLVVGTPTYSGTSSWADRAVMIADNGLTGITLATPGDIKFEAGGSWGAAYEKMRIASNGNVGIGQTNPQAKLEVNGDLRFNLASGTLSGNSLWGATYRTIGAKTKQYLNIIGMTNPNEVVFKLVAPANITGGTVGVHAVNYADSVPRNLNTYYSIDDITYTASGSCAFSAGNCTSTVTLTSLSQPYVYIKATIPEAISNQYYVGVDSLTSSLTTNSSFTNIGFEHSGLQIDGSGNIGIGTTNPGNYKLNVAGDVYIGGVTVTNGALGFGGNLDMKGNDIINTSNIGIGVSAPGTAALAVLGGNVGIGTTNPRLALEVNGAIRVGSGASDDDIQLVRDGAGSRQLKITSSGGSTGVGINLQMNSGWLNPITDNTGNLGDATHRWNSLRVGTADSSFAGNVGIGTSNPTAKLALSGGQLSIRDDGSTDMQTYGNDLYIGSSNAQLFLDGTSTNGMAQLLLQGRTGGTAKTLTLQGDGSGNLRITSGGTGNVGIGIGATGPITKLQLGEPYSGVLSGWSSTATQGIMIGQDTDNMYVGLINEGSNADRAAIIFGDDSDDYFRILRNDSSGGLAELLRLTYTGNLTVSGNTITLGGVNMTTPGVTGAVITSGNIGSQSVNYAASAGSVAWGNVSGKPTTVSGFGITDFVSSNSASAYGIDSAITNGHYYVTGVSLFGQTDGAVYAQSYSSSWVGQIYQDYRSGQLAIRGKKSGTWQSWRTVVDSSNVGSYALPLSGGTITSNLTVNGDFSCQSVKIHAGDAISRTATGPLYLGYANTNTLYFGTGAGGTTMDFRENVLKGITTLTTSGNVGIGITSPSASLHVNKAIASQGDPTTGLAYFYNSDATSTANASLALRVASSAAGDPFLSMDINGEYGWTVGVDNSDSNKFKIDRGWAAVGENNDFAIDTTGNVGIGIASPSTKLEITGGNITFTDGKLLMKNNQDIQFKNSAGTYKSAMYVSTADVLTISNDGLNTTINPSSGNVGIGTASMDSRLVVKSSGTTSATSGLNVTKSDGTSVLFVRDDGRVGINNTSPTYGFDVNTGFRVNSSGSIQYDWGIGRTLSVGSMSASTYTGEILGRDLVLGMGTGGGPDATISTYDTNENLTLDPNGTGNIIMQGNAGIGTTNPSYKLDVTDDVRVGAISPGHASGSPDLFVQGNLEVDATAYLDGPLVVAGGASFGGGTGKITVGTVDPVYNIDGKKYATYMAGMTGVKEETVGVIRLANAGGSVKGVLDFFGSDEGSDVWLFSNITDFGKEWENLVIILTPSFDGKIWYEKDIANKKLIIHSNKEGEVSFRLTAPRFNHTKWPNIYTGGTEEGMKVR